MTAQTAADPQLRASILDMLKDRMGLTGANAEKFADQMIARMQNADPNFDFQAMIDWCNQFNGDRADGPSGPANGRVPGNGRGMMGGSGSSYGGGMMGGWGVN